MKAAFGVIGSAVEAWTLKTWIDENGFETYDAPDGWTHLGNGTTREVYLSPSGVVYKVGDHGCNIDEYHCAQKLQDKLRASSARTVRATKVLYFPKVRFFESLNVLAMEYCGEHELEDGSNLYYDALDALGKLGLSSDFYYRNGIEMADGRCGVIDLGYEYASETYL